MTDQAASPRRRVRRPMLPLPLTVAILALTYWCVDIVTPGLPAIQADLLLSGAGAGLVASVFFAGRLVTNLPAALLIERVGPRGSALLGAFFLGGGSLGAAVASDEAPLLAARGLQGAGVALLATAGLLSVLRAWPGSGAAMTAFNVSAGIGGSLGLLSGGLLTAEFGWRGIFWLCAGLAGAMLIGTLLVPTVDSARRPNTAAEPEEDAIALQPTVGAALIAALLANLLVYGNYSIWVVALALFATDRFGAGPGELGTLLLLVNAVHLLAAVPVGRAIRRIGATRAMAAGFGVGALGMALIAVTPAFAWLYPPMTLYAIGQIAGNSAAGDLVLHLGGQGGRAVGLLRLTSDIGLGVSPFVVGLLADAAGVAAPFAVLSTLSAAASLIAWWTGGRRHRLP